MLEINIYTIFIAALITALATGLGALPFFFVGQVSKVWQAVASTVAAGLMLGASYGLINEGIGYSPWRLMVGMGLGVLFMGGLHRILAERDDLHVGQLEGANAMKALLIVGTMTLHSFSEGVGVGVSFGGGETLGSLITTAIAVHNIPEGLAISVVLVPRGVPALKAVWWSIFSSLPQPLMAVPAFLFVTAFAPILPAGLGFAAGAMIWLSFAELIPEALEILPSSRVGGIMTGAIGVMALFQHWLEG